MCLSIPGQIKEIKLDGSLPMGRVDFGGVIKEVCLDYVPEAKVGQYKGENRPFVQLAEHPDLIFEPGKCIDCGLCIQITEKAGEKTGLTFTGRGFNVRVAVPFSRSIVQAIQQTNTAKECDKTCPTGALSFKISDGDEQNSS